MLKRGFRLVIRCVALEYIIRRQCSRMLMKKKPLTDHSLTLKPYGSRMFVKTNRFAVVNVPATIAEVSWDDVQVIYAYTRFMNGVGKLCLDFVLPPISAGEEEDRVIVNESVEGWDALKVALAQTYPSLDQDWERKASIPEYISDLASGGFGSLVPKFTANITGVWRRFGS